MKNMKNKKLILFLSLNILLVIIISFGINYAYSKLYWSNRVSIHSGINSDEYLGNEVLGDSLTKAYVGQAYKIGTAFEVYKPKDPLLKIVSENHGAIELAVASGTDHFSDLAKPRDAVIRKVGEGDLIFSIPSYTDENVRSIIFGNESKVFLELTNANEVLIDARNIVLNREGEMTLRDIRIQEIDHSQTLSEYLFNLDQKLKKAYSRIDSLEKIIAD